MSSVSRRLRMAILERDGYRCVYCGRSSSDTILEVDHVVARAHGGANTPRNLVTACTTCNGGKSASPVALPDELVLLRPLPSWFTDRQRTPTRRASPQPARSRRAELRCDLCREPADTVHVVPWVVVDPGDPQDVLFACPRHDPGGYWFEIRQIREGEPDWRPERAGKPYTMLDHIEESKQGGRAVVALIRARAEAGYDPTGRVAVAWRIAGTNEVVRRVAAWQPPATGAAS